MCQLPFSSGTETNQLNPSSYPVLVDTDIGDDIDDAFALALTLRSPEIALLGVTTVFGDTRLRAQLAQRLLHTFGQTAIPVAAGVGTPLLYRHPPSSVPQASVLKERTPCEPISDLSGPELIIQTALAHQQQLILLCFGPLTNIATALKREPRLFLAIRKIVMVGGSSSYPFPEWNVRSDASAARIVLASGIPITLIGWNVTTRCQLCNNDIRQLQLNGSPQTDLLYQLLSIWREQRPRWHSALPYIHDALAVAALCQPDLFQFQDMAVSVPLHGPLKGFMISRLLNGPLVNAAVSVQANAARTWVMRRLLALSSQRA